MCQFLEFRIFCMIVEKLLLNTSIRLGRYFGISDDYFFKIQNELDLRNVLMKNKSDFYAIRRVTVKQ